MAMIECCECHNQVSDKAGTCPHCGAPVNSPITSAATDPSPPKKRKTHPIAWAALIVLIVLGVIGYYSLGALREAALPPMPVEVQFRKALLGPGLVLCVTNTSARHLSLLATLTNPTTKEAKGFRLDVAPHEKSEVGHLEGWVLESGDQIRITHNDYKPWQGSIP